MSKAQHTPGPLDCTKIYPVEDGKIWRAVIHSSGHPFATAYGDTKEEAEANARLVVAAPDLFEALQLLLECPQLQGGERSTAWAFIRQARAAIAKARGE